MERIRDIENETNRLQAAFQALDMEEVDGDTEIELQNICMLLEREASKSVEIDAKSEIVAKLLAEADDRSGVSWVDHRDLNVQNVLRHSWMEDEVISLLTENAILDGVS